MMLDSLSLEGAPPNKALQRTRALTSFGSRAAERKRWAVEAPSEQGTLTSVTAHGSICRWARSAGVGTSSLPGRVTILLDMSTCTERASS